MRSLSKISLAILAVGFLVVAGSAFAQDSAKPQMTITGDIDSAFGQYSFDKTSGSSTPAANQKAFSEFVTSWESNIRFTWSSDALDAIVRYRFRASNEGSGGSGNAAANATSTLQSGSADASSANDAYHEVWWKSGAFKLGLGKFQGQGWSQPLSGTYVLINPIEIAAGASEYWMNWTGISGLDAEYNVGAVQVGLAISSQCKPSCGNAVSNNTIARSEVNTSSMVPHLTGKFGDIAIRAQLPITAGTIQNSGAVTTATPPASADPIKGTGIDATSTKSVSGSGFQAGVQWASGGLKVALDVSSFTDTKVAEINGSTAKDRSRAGTALRVDVPAGPGSVIIGYFTQDDNNFSDTTVSSSIMTLRYAIPTGFGSIIPEFRSATTGKAIAATSTTGAADATNSEFRLMFQAPIL